jgi:hypothetical protein
MAFYCGAECQRKDRKVHMDLCESSPYVPKWLYVLLIECDARVIKTLACDMCGKYPATVPCRACDAATFCSKRCVEVASERVHDAAACADCKARAAALSEMSKECCGETARAASIEERMSATGGSRPLTHALACAATAMQMPGLEPLVARKEVGSVGSDDIGSSDGESSSVESEASDVGSAIETIVIDSEDEERAVVAEKAKKRQRTAKPTPSTASLVVPAAPSPSSRMGSAKSTPEPLPAAAASPLPRSPSGSGGGGGGGASPLVPIPALDRDRERKAFGSILDPFWFLPTRLRQSVEEVAKLIPVPKPDADGTRGAQFFAAYRKAVWQLYTNIVSVADATGEPDSSPMRLAAGAIYACHEARLLGNGLTSVDPALEDPAADAEYYRALWDVTHPVDWAIDRRAIDLFESRLSPQREKDWNSVGANSKYWDREKRPRCVQLACKYRYMDDDQVEAAAHMEEEEAGATMKRKYSELKEAEAKGKKKESKASNKLLRALAGEDEDLVTSTASASTSASASAATSAAASARSNSDPFSDDTDDDDEDDVAASDDVESAAPAPGEKAKTIAVYAKIDYIYNAELSREIKVLKFSTEDPYDKHAKLQSCGFADGVLPCVVVSLEDHAFGAEGDVVLRGTADVVGYPGGISFYDGLVDALLDVALSREMIVDENSSAARVNELTDKLATARTAMDALSTGAREGGGGGSKGTAVVAATLARLEDEIGILEKDLASAQAWSAKLAIRYVEAYHAAYRGNESAVVSIEFLKREQKEKVVSVMRLRQQPYFRLLAHAIKLKRCAHCHLELTVPYDADVNPVDGARRDLCGLCVGRGCNSSTSGAWPWLRFFVSPDDPAERVTSDKAKEARLLSIAYDTSARRGENGDGEEDVKLDEGDDDDGESDRDEDAVDRLQAAAHRDKEGGDGEIDDAGDDREELKEFEKADAADAMPARERLGRGQKAAADQEEFARKLAAGDRAYDGVKDGDRGGAASTDAADIAKMLRQRTIRAVLKHVDAAGLSDAAEEDAAIGWDEKNLAEIRNGLEIRRASDASRGGAVAGDGKPPGISEIVALLSQSEGLQRALQLKPAVVAEISKSKKLYSEFATLAASFDQASSIYRLVSLGTAKWKTAESAAAAKSKKKKKKKGAKGDRGSLSMEIPATDAESALEFALIPPKRGGGEGGPDDDDDDAAAAAADARPEVYGAYAPMMSGGIDPEKRRLLAGSPVTIDADIVRGYAMEFVKPRIELAYKQIEATVDRLPRSATKDLRAQIKTTAAAIATAAAKCVRMIRDAIDDRASNLHEDDGDDKGDDRPKRKRS